MKNFKLLILAITTTVFFIGCAGIQPMNYGMKDPNVDDSCEVFLNAGIVESKEGIKTLEENGFSLSTPGRTTSSWECLGRTALMVAAMTCNTDAFIFLAENAKDGQRAIWSSGNPYVGRKNLRGVNISNPVLAELDNCYGTGITEYLASRGIDMGADKEIEKVHGIKTLDYIQSILEDRDRSIRGIKGNLE
jgi:hypothetical protein